MANEGSAITHSSSRNTRSTPEEQVLAPIFKTYGRNMRKAHGKQNPVPISEPKTKKRRFFKEEISIPVSTPEEVSNPV